MISRDTPPARASDHPARHSSLITRHSSLPEVLDLVPLYAAALAVTLCGIAAVNLTIDDPSLASLTVLLTCLGFVVSLTLRLLGVDPNQAMYPLLGIALFVTLQRLLGGEGLLDFLVVGLRGSNVQPDTILATLLSWLVVLRSFGLLTNYSLLFCVVPTIAMLGLTASSNPDPEIILYFLFFLLATIFMVGYEHHLRLRDESARAELPPLRVHASTALALFIAVAAVGGALSLTTRPLLSRLSPFTTPILRKTRNLPTFNNALQGATGGYVPVGSGPISLSDTPVFAVQGARNTQLWRTRTYDHYTTRGWQSSQSENLDNLEVRKEVSFTPPRVDDLQSPSPYYQFDLRPDPARRRPVPPRPITQQIVVLSDLPSWLPVPGRPMSLICPFPNPVEDAAGVVFVREPLERGSAYQITADRSEPRKDQLERTPPVDPQSFYQPDYLELPVGTERVQQLARRLTANDQTAYDKANTLQQYIEDNCPYTLQEEVTPQGTDAVDYYLFVTKEGACDLAGSAMAILCRSVGIPARVAVGYLEGIEDPQSHLRTLRESDSHLWVELYFPGYGWVTFNPRPVSIDAPANLPGQVARSARKLWRDILRRGLVSLMTLALILLFLAAAARPGFELWWATLQERRRAAALARRGDLTAILALRYRELTGLLDRAGWPRSPAETPTAFLTRLRTEMPPHLADARAAAEKITDAFVRARYAEEPVASEVETEVSDQLRQLRQLLRRRKRMMT